MNAVDNKPPSSALWLGGLGAVPFLGLAAAIPFLAGAQQAFAMQALVGYGATILSFLGGVHWGMAIQTRHDALPATLWARLILSVIPSLAAWSALLAGGRPGLVILAASIAAMLWVDFQAARAGHAPAWYLKLRIPLTAVVVSALLFAAWA
jgi:hypothetical protein